MTPVGFARFSKEQVYKALAEGGLKIRQYFFELGEDEINGLAKQVTSATKFTVESSMDEHFGRLYIFAKEETLNDAKIYRNPPYIGTRHTVLSKENILIERMPIPPRRPSMQSKYMDTSIDLSQYEKR
jgi:hypothetical protein